MLATQGGESFDILRDPSDRRSSMFVQKWATHEAHDAAFADRILASGHLENVLDEGVVQTFTPSSLTDTGVDRIRASAGPRAATRRRRDRGSYR
jgi:hypothetical protein